MHIQRFDAITYSLERAIPLLADSEEEKSRRREDQEQEVEFRRELEQEKQLEEMRIEMRKQFKKKEEKKKEGPKGKPPKLVIAKFDCATLDWFRFSDQVKTEIDQQGYISPVTKYSYLKEFLLSHVANPMLLN